MKSSGKISRARLRRIRWVGESAFRVLSHYYFTVRWNRKQLGTYVRRVLDEFAIAPDPAEARNPPTPGLPVGYSVLDLGTDERKARYRLLYGEQELFAAESAGETLEHLFWHINSETFRTAGTFLLIHAGAVASPSGSGILLPGASGSGKSSLTTELVRRGFGYLSDEAGAIDPVTRRLYPYPKAITLKKDAGGRFGVHAELRPRANGRVSMKRQWHLAPGEIRPGAVARPCAVGLIVAPRYGEGSKTRVTPMTPAEGAFELAQNALNIQIYRGRALPLLADVARQAEGFRLVSGDLKEAADSIMRLAEGTGPGPGASA